MGTVYCGPHAEAIGSDDHEGYAARILLDGTETGTWTYATREFSGYRASCTCGWTGSATHPPTDAGEDAALDDWDRDHLRPLIEAAAQAHLIKPPHRELPTATAPNGSALLDALRAALTAYVVLPSPQAADAVTLWIAATHVQPAWAHAPRLVIRGPEKRCGKSRLLDIVEATCHRPLITVNASPAAVYRSITEDPPTLLVDEADTIFGPRADSNEGLRGLLNAGHQRNRPAVRYDGASNQVVTIPTFAMAAFAGIGAMPDTIEDRAVVIRMRRRTSDEQVSPYRHRRDRPRLHALANQLSYWLRAGLETLERAEPPMPAEDRAADTWEPLVAVADHAGNHWPDRARAAVLHLTAEANGDDTSIGVRLLADCRVAFSTDQAVSTVTLLDRLKADPNQPWLELGPSGLSAAKLGLLLREYGIRPRNIRFPDSTQAKGYKRADFLDPWTRYCTESTPMSFDAPQDPGGDFRLTHEGSIVPANQTVPSQGAMGRLGRTGRLATRQRGPS